MFDLNHICAVICEDLSAKRALQELERNTVLIGHPLVGSIQPEPGSSQGLWSLQEAQHGYSVKHAHDSRV